MATHVPAPNEGEDVASRRHRELETLHRLGQAIAVSLEPEEVMERSLEALVEMGWFDCGEAYLKNSTLETVCVGNCPFEPVDECPLRPKLLQQAEETLEHGEVRDEGGWQLVPIEDQALLALSGGNGSHSFLQAVSDLVGSSLKRAWLHRRLAEKERQRSKLIQALMTAQEEERGRISRDLHDQIGQSLTAMLLGLDKAIQNPDRAELQRLKELASISLGDVRRIALDLRPSVLDELGLEAAVRRYAREVIERYGLEVGVLVGLPHRLSQQAETVLYRVVQEAITNVVRHARATGVSVVVTATRDHVKLVVEDDGVGFDPDALLPGEQVGLLGMRERLELLGGSLRIESNPGEGCSLYAQLPRWRWGG